MKEKRALGWANSGVLYVVTNMTFEFFIWILNVAIQRSRILRLEGVYSRYAFLRNPPIGTSSSAFLKSRTPVGVDHPTYHPKQEDGLFFSRLAVTMVPS